MRPVSVVSVSPFGPCIAAEHHLTSIMDTQALTAAHNCSSGLSILAVYDPYSGCPAWLVGSICRCCMIVQVLSRHIGLRPRHKTFSIFEGITQENRAPAAAMRLEEAPPVARPPRLHGESAMLKAAAMLAPHLAGQFALCVGIKNPSN